MIDQPPPWVRDAVFYQVFPDRFASSGRVPKPGPLEPWDAPPTTRGFKGGDLLGVVEHLDHLERLGVTAIYLNPVFASASNHRYHTYDYLAVDPLLGGDAALRELIDACHGRSMRVILDGVFNHTGRGFWPFHHVLEAGWASPYRDWFHFDEEALRDGRAIRAYPSSADGSLELRDAGREVHDDASGTRALGYAAWWNLPALPKLNTDHPAVREYLFGVAEHWTRFGIDGWRLDVPEEIRDAEFWREFRRRVKAINPDAYIVAEIWEERPEVLQGDRYDALMNYPLLAAILSFVAGDHRDDGLIGTNHTIRAAVTRDDGPAFARRLEHLLSVYDPPFVAAQLNLLDSHDTPRFLSMAGGDAASFRMATLVQMTMPGAPCIYYGDEVGLPGGADPDSRRAFPWDSQDAWDRDLLAFVSATTALRDAHPALRSDQLRVLGASGPLAAYLRGGADADGSFVVALNAGEEPGSLAIEAPTLAGRALQVVVLPGDRPSATFSDPVVDKVLGPVVDSSGRAAIAIPARGGRLFRVIPPTA